MEVATVPAGIRAEYSGLGLRTRGRIHESSACHTPGCRHTAVEGKRFCKSCQATLDRIRNELKAAKPRGRRQAFRKAA